MFVKLLVLFLGLHNFVKAFSIEPSNAYKVNAVDDDPSDGYLKFIDTKEFVFDSKLKTKDNEPQLECDRFSTEIFLCFNHDQELDTVSCENTNFQLKDTPVYSCDFNSSLSDQVFVNRFIIDCDHPNEDDSQKYFIENTCYLKYSLIENVDYQEASNDGEKSKLVALIIIGIIVGLVLVFLAVLLLKNLRDKRASFLISGEVSNVATSFR